MTRIPDVTPHDGQVVTLLLDGRALSVWWGPTDDDERDGVAVRGGRLLTWPTADSCVAAARAAGWSTGDDEVERTEVDAGPVQDWLGGRAVALDPDTALLVWNLATDIAVSARSPLNDRGWAADRCHDKLTYASVPWLIDRESYVPRWTPTELRRLRAVLGDAVHVLRTALRSAPRTT